jgi:hypothetical protein
VPPPNKFVKLSLSMSTRHIGRDVIQLHWLLTFAFGGEWSTSRSGRCVPREAFRYPQIRVRDGHHRQCGRYGEQKNILHPPGFETDRSAHSLVTILSYPCTFLLTVDNQKEKFRHQAYWKFREERSFGSISCRGKQTQSAWWFQKHTLFVQEGKRGGPDES